MMVHALDDVFQVPGDEQLVLDDEDVRHLPVRALLPSPMVELICLVALAAAEPDLGQTAQANALSRSTA